LQGFLPAVVVSVIAFAFFILFVLFIVISISIVIVVMVAVYRIDLPAPVGFQLADDAFFFSR
jgi:hypothetical protein